MFSSYPRWTRRQRSSITIPTRVICRCSCILIHLPLRNRCAGGGGISRRAIGALGGIVGIARGVGGEGAQNRCFAVVEIYFYLVSIESEAVDFQLVELSVEFVCAVTSIGDGDVERVVVGDASGFGNGGRGNEYPVNIQLDIGRAVFNSGDVMPGIIIVGCGGGGCGVGGTGIIIVYPERNISVRLHADEIPAVCARRFIFLQNHFDSGCGIMLEPTANGKILTRGEIEVGVIGPGCPHAAVAVKRFPEFAAVGKSTCCSGEGEVIAVRRAVTIVICPS